MWRRGSRLGSVRVAQFRGLRVEERRGSFGRCISQFVGYSKEKATCFIRRSCPSNVTSCSTRRRTSLISRCRSISPRLLFNDTLSTNSSVQFHRIHGLRNMTDPSNASSTPLRTRSATPFHPTCNIHQLIVKNLLSTSSLIGTAPSI